MSDRKRPGVDFMIFACAAPLFYPVLILDAYIAREANKIKWIWGDIKFV